MCSCVCVCQILHLFPSISYILHMSLFHVSHQTSSQINTFYYRLYILHFIPSLSYNNILLFVFPPLLNFFPLRFVSRLSSLFTFSFAVSPSPSLLSFPSLSFSSSSPLFLPHANYSQVFQEYVFASTDHRSGDRERGRKGEWWRERYI